MLRRLSFSKPIGVPPETRISQSSGSWCAKIGSVLSGVPEEDTWSAPGLQGMPDKMCWTEPPDVLYVRSTDLEAPGSSDSSSVSSS